MLELSKEIKCIDAEAIWAKVSGLEKPQKWIVRVESTENSPSHLVSKTANAKNKADI